MSKTDTRAYEIVGFSGSHDAKCDFRDPIIHEIGASVFLRCDNGIIDHASEPMDEFRLREQAEDGFVTQLREPVKITCSGNAAPLPGVLIIISSFLTRVIQLGDDELERWSRTNQDKSHTPVDVPQGAPFEDGRYSYFQDLMADGDSKYVAVVLDEAFTRPRRERWAVSFLESATSDLLRTIETGDLDHADLSHLEGLEEDCKFGLAASLAPDLRESICLRLATYYTLSAKATTPGSDCEQALKFYFGRFKPEFALDFSEFCSLVRHFIGALQLHGVLRKTASFIQSFHSGGADVPRASASAIPGLSSYVSMLQDYMSSHSRGGLAARASTAKHGLSRDRTALRRELPRSTNDVGLPLIACELVLTRASQVFQPLQAYADFARVLREQAGRSEQGKERLAQKFADAHRQNLPGYGIGKDAIEKARDRIRRHYSVVFRPFHDDDCFLAFLAEPIVYVFPEAWRILPDGSILMHLASVLNEHPDLIAGLQHFDIMADIVNVRDRRHIL